MPRIQEVRSTRTANLPTSTSTRPTMELSASTLHRPKAAVIPIPLLRPHPPAAVQAARVARAARAEHLAAIPDLPLDLPVLKMARAELALVLVRAHLVAAEVLQLASSAAGEVARPATPSLQAHLRSGQLTMTATPAPQVKMVQLAATVRLKSNLLRTEFLLGFRLPYSSPSVPSLSDFSVSLT